MIQSLINATYRLIGLLALFMALGGLLSLGLSVESGVIRPAFGHDRPLLPFAQYPATFLLWALVYFSASLFFLVGAWYINPEIGKWLLRLAMVFPPVRWMANSRLSRRLQHKWNAALWRPVVYVRIERNRVSCLGLNYPVGEVSRSAIRQLPYAEWADDPRLTTAFFKSLFAQVRIAKRWTRSPVVVLQSTPESGADSRNSDLSSLMRAAKKAGAAFVWILPSNPDLTDNELSEMVQRLESI